MVRQFKKNELLLLDLEQINFVKVKIKPILYIYLNYIFIRNVM